MIRCLHADLEIQSATAMLHQEVVLGEESEVVKLGLLSEEDMPRDFHWLTGFRVVSGSQTGAEMMRVFAYMFPRLFAISGGLPLLWRCSVRDAGFYLRCMRRINQDYGYTIRRGSLRPNNPYPPLDMPEGQDEHIVMLEEERPSGPDQFRGHLATAGQREE